jgi:hypothetical protein
MQVITLSPNPCHSEVRHPGCPLDWFNAKVALRRQDVECKPMTWQAPRLYKKHGYHEASRIANYIGGFYLAIMRKSLYGMNEGFA